MPKDCNLPRPQPGKFTVEHRAGRGWLVISPDRAVVAGPFGGKDNALTNCVARQRAADLAAKRMVRPCMCCGQAFTQRIEHRLQRRQVEPAGPVARHPEVAPGNLAPKGRALEVEEAPGALEIGQRVGVAGNQALEFRPGGDLEAERVQKLGVMALEDAK